MEQQNFKKYFETNAPKAKKVLIVPETFTRNLNYLENVRAMQKLLQLAKLEAAVGFLGETLPQNPHEVSLPSGEKLVLEQLERKNGALQVKSFKPDAILLNNDCSDGIPEILQNVSQPIFPSPDLGWHTKSWARHLILIAGIFAPSPIRKAMWILKTSKISKDWPKGQSKFWGAQKPNTQNMELTKSRTFLSKVMSGPSDWGSLTSNPPMKF